MPLPMVHLAISRQVRELTGSQATPAFLLGSISPDAIHMRPGSTRQDKRHTHLLDAPGPASYQPIRELWHSRRADGRQAAEFTQGYASHLLADRMWIRSQEQRFLRSAPRGASHHDLARLYYGETDWIDLDLYARMPWREQVWEQLAAARPVDFRPLLTAEEIGKWRGRTLI